MILFQKTTELGIENELLISSLSKIGKTNTHKNFDDFLAFITGSEDITEAEVKKAENLRTYFCNPWTNSAINGYVVNEYLSPNLPKFMYYDEYYTLPSNPSSKRKK